MFGKICGADEGWSVLALRSSEMVGGSRGFEQSSPSFTGSVAESTSGRAVFASLLCCFQIHVDRAAFSSRCWVALEEHIVRRRWSSNVRSVWDGKLIVAFLRSFHLSAFSVLNHGLRRVNSEFLCQPVLIHSIVRWLGSLLTKSHGDAPMLNRSVFLCVLRCFLLRVLREFQYAFRKCFFVVF